MGLAWTGSCHWSIPQSTSLVWTSHQQCSARMETIQARSLDLFSSLSFLFILFLKIHYQTGLLYVDVHIHFSLIMD